MQRSELNFRKRSQEQAKFGAAALALRRLPSNRKQNRARKRPGREPLHIESPACNAVRWWKSNPGLPEFLCQGEASVKESRGCLPRFLGVGIGLALGMLAGVFVGLMLGVGISMVLGIL